MKTKNVIEAQKKAIEALKKVISSFAKAEKSTRVIPLAIPTGWGKTRIAIQAVLKAEYKKQEPPIVVIWPQKQSHMSNEVWRRCSDWCSKRDRSKCIVEDCDWNEIPEIEPLDSSKTGPKMKRHERGARTHSRKFKGTFYSVNNKFKGIKNQLDKSKGLIVFLIDEWHSKKLLEKYQQQINEETSMVEDAESFWRNLLIGKNSSRNLMVVLISATPIGTASHMDSIKTDEDVDEYKENINNAMATFNELTEVGNQNREYNLYKIYPEVIKSEEKKLAKRNARENYIGKVGKKKWADEYIRLSRKIYSNNPKTVYPPSLVYPLESLTHSGVTLDLIKEYFGSSKKYFSSGFTKQQETLKLKTAKELLKKYPQRKFVIFCHYKAVAHSLCEYLKKHKISCYHLEGDVKKRDREEQDNPNNEKSEFQLFNDKNGTIRALIVTDEHSQGISLHKTRAWLLHFELSWNPIRIIQRYGRVWRIDKNTRKLTQPVSFYIPHSFSSEEEMIARLQRRWAVLENLPEQKDTFVNLAPISFEVALGIRCTPSP